MYIFGDKFAMEILKSTQIDLCLYFIEISDDAIIIKSNHFDFESSFFFFIKILDYNIKIVSAISYVENKIPLS